MSEDLKEKVSEQKKDIRELYNSRNDHDIRINALEIGFVQIQQDQKSIREDIKGIRDIQEKGFGEIQKYIKETQEELIKINGKPAKNEERLNSHTTEINQIKSECALRGAQQKGLFTGIKETAWVAWIIIALLLAILGYFLKRELDCRKLPAQKQEIGVESNKIDSAGKETPKNKTP